MRDAQNKENTVNTNNLPKLAPLLSKREGVKQPLRKLLDLAVKVPLPFGEGFRERLYF